MNSTITVQTQYNIIPMYKHSKTVWNKVVASVSIMEHVVKNCAAF